MSIGSFNLNLGFMQKYLSFFLTFVSFIPGLFASYEKQEMARLFKEACLFDSAITLYQDILRNWEDDSQEAKLQLVLKNIYFSLAECYFQNENFQKTIELLEAKCDTNDEYLLLAMAFNRLQRYEEAISTLYSSPDLLKADRVIYELGIAHLYLNKFEEAASNFEKLLNSNVADLSYLSRIYLARIYLQSSCFEKAEEQLLGLEVLLEEHVLQKELCYLQGQLFFQKGDYKNAAAAFEKVFPTLNMNDLSLYNEVLYHLGWSYLKAIDDPQNTRNISLKLFEKAEDAFTRMNENERPYLSLGACYLSRAHILKDESAYLKANQILSRQDLFLSNEAKTEAELLRAAVAPSYLERDFLYRELTLNKNKEGLFYAKTLYLKGLNDFEEGKNLSLQKREEEALPLLERAAYFLAGAADFFKNENKKLAGLSLKYQAQSFAEENRQDGFLKAFLILDNLIQKSPEILTEMTDPDEIYYLRALMLLKLEEYEKEHVDQKRYHSLIEGSLKINLALYPKGKFADLSLNLIATFYYQNKEYAEAAKRFLQFESSLKSDLKAEKYFYAALSFEQLGEDEKVKDLRKKIYTEYPDSKYAAESYFRYYSYQDYVQGDRSSIKHLQSFIELFKDTPFLLNAHYLLGIDYTRDRKTIDGKWIRKKSLTSAIDHFQLAVSIFDKLYSEGFIENELDYFVMIRYLAMFEKGMTFLKVADDSQGTKSDIYLEYAESVFSEIIEDYNNKENSLVLLLNEREPFPSLQEESYYYLAISYIKAKNSLLAKKTFDEMIKNYQALNITRSYFLSRVFYELGVLFKGEEEYASALQKFIQSDDAAKGKILSGEQKLDLWIEQSLCYLGLKQYDLAILILSKVVNCDMVSAKRLKAMFLRAEIYECQGRFELCRKQLEALAKKGGEWAVKAKQRLENLKN